MPRFIMLTTVVLLAVAEQTRAGTKVELKSVHMCCEGCADEVAEILKKVDGLTGIVVDLKSTTARFSATSAEAAQKALDALAEGGFHGDTGGAKDFAFKNDSGVKAGNVKVMTVTGFHNSCAGCVKSFRAALKDVKGVTDATLKSNVRSARITGDFDASEVVTALNKAGFHVKAK